MSLAVNCSGSRRYAVTKSLFGPQAEHHYAAALFIDHFHVIVTFDGSFADHLAKANPGFPASGCVIRKVKALGVVSDAMEVIARHEARMLASPFRCNQAG